jgi:hypothetical protein
MIALNAHQDKASASRLLRTWAPRGHTPVIRHRFKWPRGVDGRGAVHGSRGGGAALAFHHQPSAHNTQTLIGALGELRRFLGGEKATLVWDGLPAHRNLAMAAWLRRQRSWLVVERLPGYAPELNPVEGLWSSLNGRELARSAGDGASLARGRHGAPGRLTGGAGAPRGARASPSRQRSRCAAAAPQRQPSPRRG